MATIAVIGATGRTGRLIVDRALAAGHTVTAVSRRPQAPTHPHHRLRQHAADVLHSAQLRVALRGQDAVPLPPADP